MTHWYDIVNELIDMRSFSSLWYWISLAVMWSSTSHWVLGVPWDMVARARRYDNPKDVRDLEEMLRINCERIDYIIGKSGLLLAGVTFFILTVLSLLGFLYGNEFSQAIFFMILPMSLVVLLSIKYAKSLIKNKIHGNKLYKKLYLLRLILQMLGVFFIFITAMWGMLQNMRFNAFGVF